MAQHPRRAPGPSPLPIAYIDAELSTAGLPVEVGAALRQSNNIIDTFHAYVRWPAEYGHQTIPFQVAPGFSTQLNRKIASHGRAPDVVASEFAAFLARAAAVGCKSAPAELKALEHLFRFCPTRITYFDIDHYLPRANNSPLSLGRYFAMYDKGNLIPATGPHDALWDAYVTGIVADAAGIFTDDGLPILTASALFGLSRRDEELTVRNGTLRYASLELGHPGEPPAPLPFDNPPDDASYVGPVTPELTPHAGAATPHHARGTTEAGAALHHHAENAAWGSCWTWGSATRPHGSP